MPYVIYHILYIETRWLSFFALKKVTGASVSDWLPQKDKMFLSIFM